MYKTGEKERDLDRGWWANVGRDPVTTQQKERQKTYVVHEKVRFRKR